MRDIDGAGRIYQHLKNAFNYHTLATKCFFLFWQKLAGKKDEGNQQKSTEVHNSYSHAA